MDETVSQMVVVTQSAINENQDTERVALFQDDGTPIGPASFTPVTGADILLTGMVAGTADPVAATDSTNEAVAKLQAQVDVDPTGADVLLTGYEVAEAAADVDATDSVNEAFGKVQASLDDKLEAVTGADVLLTGLVAGEAADILATDTVNAAMAKIQARLDILEAT